MSHEFGNAETSELWDSLQAHVSGVKGRSVCRPCLARTHTHTQAASGSSATVNEIMDTWTKQMGYPVLTVFQSNGSLTQSRFFAVQPEEGGLIAPSPYRSVL